MTAQSTASSASIALPSPTERRRLREAKSLSEEQIATAVGVTKATVRAWETGRTSPRGRKRQLYAKLLAGFEEELAEAEPTELAEADMAEAEPVETGAEAGVEAGAGAEAAASKPLEEPAQAAKAREPEAREPGEPPTQERAQGPTPDSTPDRTADPTADRTPAPKPGPKPGQPSGQPHAPAHTPGRLAPPARAKQPPANTRPRPAVKRASKPPSVAPTPVLAPVAAPPQPAYAPVVEAERDAPEPQPFDLTPEEAFDALYAHAALGLVRQTYLLTGRRQLSIEAVEKSFQLAWDRWPEVAVDRDPVGWVRAAAYEYAMSPWHRLRRSQEEPEAAGVEGAVVETAVVETAAVEAAAVEPSHRDALLDALLELPPSYRRTLLLYDGLGLDLPETAAETEASTPAAANRVLHAREAIAERLPELSAPEVLQDRLTALASSHPVEHLTPAREVRTGSERRAQFWTRAAIAVTALIIGATACTLATSPTRYHPPVAPGERVSGVPAHGGPPQLTPRDKQLRKKLLSEPAPGPERLVPQIR
ncbi:sigma factor-like helix-turn-helix DNA-binding protein [Streptomyces sp. NPDC051907]|uniref:sigma factor-like helix-turn-helix DNA-binding protein n=1 Tax=Streptomyces sp. NPDC051907 TaxID=3155284 RepID=UPI003419BC4D